MRSNQLVLFGSLLFALAFVMAGPLSAETLCAEPLDAEGHECQYLLIAGITEEPDPINMGGGGQLAALPIGTTGTPARSSADLPSVVGSYDGAPQVVSHNGAVVAVWAHTTVGSSDIVFSEWGPDGWQEYVLTSWGSGALDPRVGIAADGAVYVTWWEIEEPRRVHVARRDPVSLQWENPEGFAGMYGSRPSILVLDDEVLVAFERRVWSGGQQIVVRRARSYGRIGPAEDVVAMTHRETPLHVELHLAGERPFMDWVHDDIFFGYSEYRDGSWGASLGSRPLTQRHWAVPPATLRLEMPRSR